MLELLTANGQVEAVTAFGLIILAGFTSFITATVGVGGGLLLLVVMATVVPLYALIPVHGLVQLGSNGNRALMTRQHTDYKMVGWFTAGAVIATVVSVFLVVQLPLELMQILMGVFILLLVWGIKPKQRELSTKGRVLTGFFTTILTMFVGATGPLVAAFVQRNNYQKMQITATFAHCMVVQNILKTLVFVSIGFALADWLVLIGLMIASGALGTWIGLKVLNKIPAAHFKTIFRVIISILAIRLCYQGGIALLA